jgi:hypothetical protein
MSLTKSREARFAEPQDVDSVAAAVLSTASKGSLLLYFDYQYHS